MKSLTEYVNEMNQSEVNKVMNRGPSIAKKRNKHGYDALSDKEKDIYDKYVELTRK